jgi:hypothetical protein
MTEPIVAAKGPALLGKEEVKSKQQPPIPLALLAFTAVIEFMKVFDIID